MSNPFRATVGEGVNPNSITETTLRSKHSSKTGGGPGVPFYLRTGKALPKRASGSGRAVQDIPQILFNANPAQPPTGQCPDSLRIQPDEGLSLRIISRVPAPAHKPIPWRWISNIATCLAAPPRKPMNGCCWM